MDDAERFERLMEVIDDLAIENLETPIVVEGRRDVESLRILGCAGEIHPLNLGNTLHERAEALAGGAKLVILLTDWDKKGDQLFEAMATRLHANGVRVDRTYRDKIQMWMRPPVKDIESLAGYVARNLARYQGEAAG
ncbi:MAG: hypothetical protein WDA16_11035 [Candidatus Thermoplasmatota archaeon]